MNREQLITTLCTKYNWQKEDCSGLSDRILARNIQLKEQEAKEEADKLRKLAENRPSYTDLRPDIENVSLEQSLRYLSVPDLDERIKLVARNNLRQHLGLDELVEMPTPQEMDYDALLLLDNFEIGQHIQAWLKKRPPYEQDQYKEKLETMINVKNHQERQRKEDVAQWYKLQGEVETIAKVPKETIINSKGDLEVNSEFKKWKQNLINFSHKLGNLEKGYSQSKPFFMEQFFEMKKEIDKLMKKYTK